MTRRLAIMILGPVFLSGAILALAPTPSRAETIVLRGGRTVEGELLTYEPTSKEFRFKLREGGVLTLRRADVERIILIEAAPATIAPSFAPPAAPTASPSAAPRAPWPPPTVSAPSTAAERQEAPASTSALSSATPSASSASSDSSRGGTVNVRGYTRKDGTYVPPHTRSAPRR